MNLLFLTLTTYKTFNIFVEFQYGKPLVMFVGNSWFSSLLIENESYFFESMTVFPRVTHNSLADIWISLRKITVCH